MSGQTQLSNRIDACRAADGPSADPRLLSDLGRLYSPEQSRLLLERLQRQVDWQYDYHAFGRRFDVPRLQAWYADPGAHYRYANNLLRHQDWIALLLGIRQDVERRTGQSFNAVLVTYYRDGRDHVTWHADDEPELGDEPLIASLSLGATRHLQYRPKVGGATEELALHDGELLLMQPDFQRDWLHCVPLEAEVNMPRINLTFRQVQMTRDHN